MKTLLALALSGFTAFAQAQEEIRSTFDADMEGWGTVDGTRNFRWVETGGNPDGHLRADDGRNGILWYFSAPAAYLGDRSDFIGGSLSWDILVSVGNPTIEADDVLLVGNGGQRITVDLSDPLPERNVWTAYRIELTAATFEVDEGTFAAIMGDLEALLIRGEYVVNADQEGLDNVSLTGPSSTVLVSAPANPAPSDELGAASAADGSLVAFGQPNANGGGQVVVYRIEAGTLVEDQIIRVPEGFFADGFGGALDLQGNRLLVGAPQTNPARRGNGLAALQAAIFERVGGDWRFKTDISAPQPSAAAEFGASVALDGELMFVGAPGEGAGGAAYGFEFDGGSSIVASQPILPGVVTPGARFGSSLAAFNGNVAVGAPGGAVGQAVAGAVTLYGLVGRNLGSVSEGETVGGVAGGDQFGRSLSMAGGTLVVGAPGEDSTEVDAGAAYLYRFSGLDLGTPGRFVSSTPEDGAAFGTAVGIGAQGVVVGAPGAAGNDGRVSRFDQRLRELGTLAPPAVGIAAFGASVATSGGVIAIGAPQSRTAAGAAFAEFDTERVFATGFER